MIDRCRIPSSWGRTLTRTSSRRSSVSASMPRAGERVAARGIGPGEEPQAVSLGVLEPDLAVSFLGVLDRPPTVTPRSISR